MVRPGFRLFLAVGLVAAGAGLAGCGSGGDDAKSDVRSSPAKSPTPTSPTPTPTPTASDGTKLRACKDGTCEVLVKRPATIEMDEEKFEIAAIKVTKLTGAAVSFEVTLSSSGHFDFNCEGDPKCETFMTGPAYGMPGMGQITAHPGARIKANGVVVEVVTADGGKAILRMKPR